MFINRWEPGPCPVDDAPHTTCTSPDYVPVQPLLTAGAPVAPVVMSVHQPFVLRGQIQAPVASTTVSEPVTTKTYRRKKR